MNSKIKKIAFVLTCVCSFVLVICASLLMNKNIDAVYEGKVTAFNTALNHETKATEFEVYFELKSGHKSSAIFYCLGKTVVECQTMWSDAVEDGKVNGYRTFTNNVMESPWTKGKIHTYSKLGLVTDDRPYLLLFSKVLLSVFVVMLLVSVLPIKSQEINYA